jgi:hypothetical protein
MKRNRIGTNGLQDLNGVLNLPNLSVLDVSDNKIADPGLLFNFKDFCRCGLVDFRENAWVVSALLPKQLSHQRNSALPQETHKPAQITQVSRRQTSLPRRKK